MEKVLIQLTISVLLDMIDPLVPFSHWITPVKNARRFTTQMYMYYMPLPHQKNSDVSKDIPSKKGSEVQVPTSDGGIEITEAQFLPATEWLRRARIGEIIMFPPQVMLLSFVAQFLDKPGPNGESPRSISPEESEKRRAELVNFTRTSTPPWTDKYISPRPVGQYEDGRLILGLDWPGPELEKSEKKGETDRVVLVRFKKEGPREVEIRWRHEVLGEQSSKSAL